MTQTRHCGDTKPHSFHIEFVEHGQDWRCPGTMFPDPKTSSLDIQVGGSHYKNFAIQPLEFIIRNNLDFVQGCVIKYVCRYKEKGGVEDLKKARHYLDVMIEELEPDG